MDQRGVQDGAAPATRERGRHLAGDLVVVRVAVEVGVCVDVGRTCEIDDGVEVGGQRLRRELRVPTVEEIAEIAVACRPDAVEVLGVGMMEASRVIGPRRLGGGDLRELQVRIAQEKHVRTARIGGPAKTENLHGRNALRIPTKSQCGSLRRGTRRSSARLPFATARGEQGEAGDREQAGRLHAGSGTKPF